MDSRSFRFAATTGLFLLISGFSAGAASEQQGASTAESSEKSSSHSQSTEPLMGHNVTPTTYTLQQGQVTLGNYLVGYGITDQLMIATSPWMATYYNMPMVGVKFGFDVGGIIERMSVEASYLKTMDYGLDLFHQESMYGRIAATIGISQDYKIHLGAGLQYFWQDAAPFSLRPPTDADNPYTASVGALQEIHFGSKTGIFLETGLLGANYPNPYAHFGGSFFVQGSNYLVQLGISCSFETQYNPNAVYKYWDNSYGDIKTNLYYGRTSLAHPEVQIQFFL